MCTVNHQVCPLCRDNVITSSAETCFGSLLPRCPLQSIKVESASNPCEPCIIGGVGRIFATLFEGWAKS